MKYSVAFSSILMTIILVMPGAHAADENIVDTVVQSYFTALKSGDVETIKTLVDGKALRQIADLLEHNEDYSRFLQDHYKLVQFDVLNVNHFPNTVAVKAKYVFGVNDVQKYRLIIKPQNGLWKIVEIVEES